MMNEVQYFRFICSLRFNVIIRFSVNEYGVYGRKHNSFHLKLLTFCGFCDPTRNKLHFQMLSVTFHMLLLLNSGS